MVYCSDDGDVLALRFDNWKVVFMEQREQGTMGIWAEPFVALRVPKLFNLRTDPYERADVTSNTYYDWFIDNCYIALAATAIVTQFLDERASRSRKPVTRDPFPDPDGNHSRQVGHSAGVQGPRRSWRLVPAIPLAKG